MAREACGGSGRDKPYPRALDPGGKAMTDRLRISTSPRLRRPPADRPSPADRSATAPSPSWRRCGGLARRIADGRRGTAAPARSVMSSACSASITLCGSPRRHAPAPPSGSSRAHRQRSSRGRTTARRCARRIASRHRPAPLPGQLARPTMHAFQFSAPVDLQQLRHRPVPAAADQRQLVAGMPYSAELVEQQLVVAARWSDAAARNRDARCAPAAPTSSRRSAAACRSRRTTAVSFASFSTCSRIGFMKLTEAAVLSPIDRHLGRPLAGGLLRQLHHVGTVSSACAPAVGEDWNTYLKPRPVIRSE